MLISELFESDESLISQLGFKFSTSSEWPRYVCLRFLFYKIFWSGSQKSQEHVNTKVKVFSISVWWIILSNDWHAKYASHAGHKVSPPFRTSCLLTPVQLWYCTRPNSTWQLNTIVLRIEFFRSAKLDSSDERKKSRAMGWFVVQWRTKRMENWNGAEIASDSSEPAVRDVSQEWGTRTAMSHNRMASRLPKQACFNQSFSC